MFGKQNIIQVKSDNFEFMLSVDDVCSSIFRIAAAAAVRGGVANFD